jgi:hypothetical protein
MRREIEVDAIACHRTKEKETEGAIKGSTLKALTSTRNSRLMKDLHGFDRKLQLHRKSSCSVSRVSGEMNAVVV